MRKLTSTSKKIYLLLERCPGLTEGEIISIVLSTYCKGYVRKRVAEQFSLDLSNFKSYISYKNESDRLRFLMHRGFVVRMKGRCKETNRRKFFYFVSSENKPKV